MKRNWLRRLAAGLLAFLLLAGSGALAQEESEPPIVCISIRDYGDIYVELYPQYAPITVQNFLKLVGENFYDGLTFHRIITGFMIQGGDPLGNGTGGSAEQIKGEFSQNGVENPLKHLRGVLSMARSSQMDSASSQFFIMHATSPHLDGAYAAFGRVISGLPVVDRICLATPVQDSNGTVLKADQPVIDSIRIVDAEAARAAVAAERQNGLAGSVYQDPLTALSFPVPAGWNRTGYPDAFTALFQPEAEESRDKSLVLLSMDIWARHGAQLGNMGYTRDAMDTDAARQVGLIRVDESLYSREEHSGVIFYTAQVAADAGSHTVYVGMHQGAIYQFIFYADRDDALFADVEAILDGLRLDDAEQQK